MNAGLKEARFPPHSLPLVFSTLSCLGFFSQQSMSSDTTSQLPHADGKNHSAKHEETQLEDLRALVQAEPKVGGIRGLLKDPKM